MPYKDLAARSASFKRRYSADPEKYRAKFRAWRKANPTKAKACTDRYRRGNKEKVRKQKRARHLSALYGLALSEYEALYTAQSGLCAICKQPETRVRAGKVLNLAVDHCHKTGKVRGLLCNTCNRAIGLFRDHPEYLQTALVYLRGQ